MKSHGWVIEMKKSSNYYPGYWKMRGIAAYSVSRLRDARVFVDRITARYMANDMEVVRMVSLFKNGNAKKIIGRG